MRRAVQIWNHRTHWTVENYIPSGAKEKRVVWFGDLKDRKSMHVELEKHMFGK